MSQDCKGNIFWPKKHIIFFYTAAIVPTIIFVIYFILDIKIEFLENNMEIIIPLGCIVIPITLLLNVKCPRCKYKFLWHWFNDDVFKKYKSPFAIKKCPKCGLENDNVPES